MAKKKNKKITTHNINVSVTAVQYLCFALETPKSDFIILEGKQTQHLDQIVEQLWALMHSYDKMV